MTGDNLDQLTKSADEVIAKIKPIKDVLKVESNQEEKKTVYTLKVNASQAKAGDIASQLQGMLNSVPIGTMKANGSLSALFSSLC
ncbi:efflux RND transporter permease subunit [Cohnella faecalis]|uniref:Efflux RND transporter permease subunit n=1 Tax=Cohnella faecalis TaxID=2315694 RepID=A0A398D306_9BACL|nr:efflux RND transporter permease subunit [Cohnella faecalis]RIE05474.1 efflux RND transporter permease subunit [Cohnella faecalis]